MNILLVLIPVTLLIVGVGVWLFFWAVNHQQFDDLDSPGCVPLLEDAPQDDAGLPGCVVAPPPLISNPESRTTRSIS